MEQSTANPLVCLAGEHHHEGHALVTIEIHGRQAWLASQVSEGLGYEKADQVTVAIVRDLVDEVEEGVDYVVLRGDELAAFKAAAPGLVDPRAPAAMLLYESGVHLVAMRARTDKARAFRRWLAEHVLPSLRRTGTYGVPDPSHRWAAVRQMVDAGASVAEIAAVLRAGRRDQVPALADGGRVVVSDGQDVLPMELLLCLPPLATGSRSMRMVLLAIESFARRLPDGRVVCTETICRIGETVGLQRRTTQRYIKRLEAEGYIKREFRLFESNIIEILGAGGAS